MYRCSTWWRPMEERRFPSVGGGEGAGWSADSGNGERPDDISRQWATAGEELGSGVNEEL